MGRMAVLTGMRVITYTKSLTYFIRTWVLPLRSPADKADTCGHAIPLNTDSIDIWLIMIFCSFCSADDHPIQLSPPGEHPKPQDLTIFGKVREPLVPSHLDLSRDHFQQSDFRLSLKVTDGGSADINFSSDFDFCSSETSVAGGSNSVLGMTPSDGIDHLNGSCSVPILIVE